MSTDLVIDATRFGVAHPNSAGVTSDVAAARDAVAAARRRGVAARLAALREDNPRLSVTSVPGANRDTFLTTHIHTVVTATSDFTQSR